MAGYCKGLCLRDTEMFHSRRTRLSGGQRGGIKRVYDDTTKRCNTCATYVHFKTIEHCASTKLCPCCNLNLRTRPHNNKRRRLIIESENVARH